MGIEESELVKDVLQGLAESTRISYITTLNRFVNEFAKDKNLDDLVQVRARAHDESLSTD